MRKCIALIFLSLILITCNTAQSTMNKHSSLEGTWELNYISGPRIAFEGLYPNAKPTIHFDLKENRVSGNNGCNKYSGQLKTNGNSISFKDPMAVTRMMCPHIQGETTYMTTLEKIDSYAISEDGKTLNFIMGDIALMRFAKK